MSQVDGVVEPERRGCRPTQANRDRGRPRQGAPLRDQARRRAPRGGHAAPGHPGRQRLPGPEGVRGDRRGPPSTASSRASATCSSTGPAAATCASVTSPTCACRRRRQSSSVTRSRAASTSRPTSRAQPRRRRRRHRGPARNVEPPAQVPRRGAEGDDEQEIDRRRMSASASAPRSPSSCCCRRRSAAGASRRGVPDAAASRSSVALVSALIDGADLTLGSLARAPRAVRHRGAQRRGADPPLPGLERPRARPRADLVRRGRGAAGADPGDHRRAGAVALPFVIMGSSRRARDRAPDGGRDPRRPRHEHARQPVRAAGAVPAVRGGRAAELTPEDDCSTAGRASSPAGARHGRLDGDRDRQPRRGRGGREARLEERADGCLGRATAGRAGLASSPACRSRPARKSRRRPRPATSRRSWRRSRARQGLQARHLHAGGRRAHRPQDRRGAAQRGQHGRPYASLIYNGEGKTFVYTTRSRCTYLRAAVKVDRIEGNRVLLTRARRPARRS